MVPRLVDQQTRERIKEPDLIGALGTLGLRMSGRDEEGKERFSFNTDINRAQQRPE